MGIEDESGKEKDLMVESEAERFNRRQAEMREGARERIENPLLDRCNELRRRMAQAVGPHHEIIAGSTDLQTQESEIQERITEVTRRAAELSQRRTEAVNLERATRMLPGSADYERVPQMQEDLKSMETDITSAEAEINATQDKIEKLISVFETAIKTEIGKEIGKKKER